MEFGILGKLITAVLHMSELLVQKEAESSNSGMTALCYHQLNFFHYQPETEVIFYSLLGKPCSKENLFRSPFHHLSRSRYGFAVR